MSTIFTKIIEGEIPGHIVWSDEVCAAFLDIEPLTPGHVLVVPRDETDHWVDLPTGTLDHVMNVAATIGRAQQQVYGAERVGIIVQGFEVPHAHVHVFPTSDPGDFDLTRKGPRDEEDLAADAAALREALER
ncbi:HIT family protein [Serinicoccus hydrothermalis]|uniref:HIT family protein n=1 Tax=Serinicoccus hydrothermalis TaxID=1758689 RepID=A0A1B1N8K9_9MICO|nr:HIT family protein [Serinicoccus hydrothermalis]ANS77770.1 HIT family protein [Serinicoccus hydrothermalis]